MMMMMMMIAFMKGKGEGGGGRSASSVPTGSPGEGGAIATDQIILKMWIVKIKHFQPLIVLQPAKPSL